MTFCLRCEYVSDYSEHAAGCRERVKEELEEGARAGAYYLGLLGAALAGPAGHVAGLRYSQRLCYDLAEFEGRFGDVAPNLAIAARIGEAIDRD